jgi:PAS domain S-box-containing protein
MNDQDKSKSELIKELQQLREDNKKFRKSYEADIAERRIAEGAIRESETRFRNLFQEVQSVSVQGYDTDGTTKYWNLASEQLYGYTAQEAIGQNLLDLIIPPEMRENVALAIQNMAETGQPIPSSELLLMRKDGSRVSVFSSHTLISIPGRPKELFCIDIDLTERKLAEEAIRNSKQQYDNLVSKIPVGVYILKTKPDGTFALEYVSPRMAEMLDLSTESLLTDKETIFKAIHPDDLDGFARLNQEGIFLKRPFDWKGRVIVKREVRWLHIRSLPEQLENGDILWHGLIVDITRQMQNEAEIKIKNDELINLNATKDKFFSIIAHDLRSPFNSFLGLTEIMAEELPNLSMLQLREMVTGMNKSATNLYRLLENLLNWSQIQKGTIPFNPEAVQIGLVIGESIEIIQEQAKNKEIEITTDIPADFIVFADINMLQAIIRNLVSNAIKYTNKGGRISLSVNATNDKNIGIAIQDTGIGMCSEMVAKLFRIDTRANRKGTDGEPSTGLGLLLCKEFVEKHGGKIWVDSEEGIGSTFYFTLPMN